MGLGEKRNRTGKVKSAARGLESPQNTPPSLSSLGAAEVPWRLEPQGDNQ